MKYQKIQYNTETIESWIMCMLTWSSSANNSFNNSFNNTLDKTCMFFINGNGESKLCAVLGRTSLKQGQRGACAPEVIRNRATFLYFSQTLEVGVIATFSFTSPSGEPARAGELLYFLHSKQTTKR